MSAYHVSDLHINVLVSWARFYQLEIYTKSVKLDLNNDQDFKNMGQILRNANNKSMMAKYRDEPIGYLPECIGHPRISMLATGNILSACRCFEYQACEYGEWEESEARSIIRQIERCCMERARFYDEFWGISDGFFEELKESRAKKQVKSES